MAIELVGFVSAFNRVSYFYFSLVVRVLIFIANLLFTSYRSRSLCFLCTWVEWIIAQTMQQCAHWARERKNAHSLIFANTHTHTGAATSLRFSLSLCCCCVHECFAKIMYLHRGKWMHILPKMFCLFYCHSDEWLGDNGKMPIKTTQRNLAKE